MVRGREQRSPRFSDHALVAALTPCRPYGCAGAQKIDSDAAPVMRMNEVVRSSPDKNCGRNAPFLKYGAIA